MKWRRILFLFHIAQNHPTKFVHEYSGDERRRFLNIFRPRAKLYIRRKLIAGLLLCVPIFISLLLTHVDIPKPLAISGAILFVICVLTSCFILAFGMRLICPACRKRLAPAKGPYCPQCGSDQYQYGRNIRGPSLSRYSYCPSCGGTIDEGGGDQPRSYKIRGCTHCGVMLDEKGL